MDAKWRKTNLPNPTVDARDEEIEHEAAQETARRIEDEEIEETAAPKKKAANRRVGVWGCCYYTISLWRHLFAAIK